jgi:hypothetical protein
MLMPDHFDFKSPSYLRLRCQEFTCRSNFATDRVARLEQQLSSRVVPEWCDVHSGHLADTDMKLRLPKVELAQSLHVAAKNLVLDAISGTDDTLIDPLTADQNVEFDLEQHADELTSNWWHKALECNQTPAYMPEYSPEHSSTEQHEASNNNNDNNSDDNDELNKLNLPPDQDGYAQTRPLLQLDAVQVNIQVANSVDNWFVPPRTVVQVKVSPVFLDLSAAYLRVVLSVMLYNVMYDSAINRIVADAKLQPSPQAPPTPTINERAPAPRSGETRKQAAAEFNRKVKRLLFSKSKKVSTKHWLPKLTNQSKRERERARGHE